MCRWAIMYANKSNCSHLRADTTLAIAFFYKRRQLRTRWADMYRVSSWGSVSSQES